MGMTGTRTRCALALTGALLAVAGCASRTHVVVSPMPAVPSNTSGCPNDLAITPDSNGKTLCVALFGGVTLTLSSPNGTKWQTPEVSGAGLIANDGGPTPAPGGQYLEFSAVKPGTVVITSSHPNCPPATGGMVSCHSIVAWKVTVDVKS
jgi:hypothetical protein